MDILPPYGLLTTTNEKMDFLGIDGGCFLRTLIITREKMYFLRKISLYFSQIRDSITPSSILRASYVFSHRNSRCPSPRSGVPVPFSGWAMFYSHRTSWCPYPRGGDATERRNYLCCLYLRGQITYRGAKVEYQY